MKLILEKTVFSPEEFKNFMGSIINVIHFNDKILLQGPLGAGKTFFVRLLLQHLGCQDFITSPTFTLINEYEINPPPSLPVQVKHIDLYRMDPSMVEDIPLEDILHSQDFVLVEWGELIPQLLHCYTKKIVFNLVEEKETARSIQVFSHHP